MTNKLLLDLNKRERDRFIKQLDTLSDLAERASSALRAEEDADFFTSIMILGLTMPGVMQELIPVLQAAQAVNLDDLDKPIEMEDE